MRPAKFSVTSICAAIYWQQLRRFGSRLTEAIAIILACINLEIIHRRNAAIMKIDDWIFHSPRRGKLLIFGLFINNFYYHHYIYMLRYAKEI